MNNKFTVKYYDYKVRSTEEKKHSPIGVIKNNMTNNLMVDIEELKKLSLNGCCIYVNTIGGTKVKDFLCTNVIPIDIDGDKSYILDKLKRDLNILNREYGFVPNLIFNSLTSCHYRLLFLFDNMLTINEFKTIKNFLNIFFGGDNATNDITHLYFNCKSSTIGVNNKLNQIDMYKECISQIALEENKKDVYYKTSGDIEGVYTKLLDKVSDNTQISIKLSDLIKDVRLIDYFFNKDVKLKYSLLKIVATNLMYIKDKESGLNGVELYHRRIKEMIDSNKDYLEIYDYDSNKPKTYSNYKDYHYYLIDRCQAKGYFPMTFKTERFPNDIKYTNILVWLDNNNITIKKEFNEMKDKQISVEVARKLLKESFIIAKSANMYPSLKNGHIVAEKGNNNDIIILKAPTGIGKSFLYETDTDFNNVVIAFKNHEEKNEKANIMREKYHIPIKITMDRNNQFSDDAINEELDFLSHTNSFNKSLQLIKSIAKGKIPFEDTTINDDDIAFAKEYLLNNAQLLKGLENILTTQKRATIDRYYFKNKDIILYDEDPIDNIISSKSIDNMLWKNFSNFVNGNKKGLNNLKNIIKMFDSIEENTMVKNTFSLDYESKNYIARLSKTMGVYKKYLSIYDLFNSDYFYKFNYKDGKYNCIDFCSFDGLNANKKIIILSATINIKLYKTIFGRRVKVVDLSNVQKASPIIQNLAKSTSKISLDKDNEKENRHHIYNEIEEGNYKVITFKDFTLPTDKIKTPDLTNNLFRIDEQFTTIDGAFHNIYAGKCEGFNRLNGCDLAVCFTMYRPMSYYIFLSKILGIEGVDYGGCTKRFYENKYFRFKMWSFGVQKIDDIIYQDLVSATQQASGRNRNLTISNIKTVIYSRIPDYNADLFVNNKTKTL